MDFLGGEGERFNPRLGPGTRHASALPTGLDGRRWVTVCLVAPGREASSHVLQNREYPPLCRCVG